MAVRIDCKLPGHEGEWVEFRDSPWPFKDRRAVLAANSDLAALTVILGYVSGSELKDVDGKPAAVSGLDSLDNLDDLVVSWIIEAWFFARNKRSEVPKAG